ncbi:ribonucleotide reductase small subunit (plasmid) [Geobacillus kaustophilus HTA426]|uniref:Ribonucleotide reductase small subunit n=1 Tax=Geobacillus kaustophilus (strain HTA426) TaxID=235909 RepID=Q5QL41_GEOKA|nr:R2-like ligand-binding oxidase [Geobacillus kaustophilus]BAD74269.1 ribonucleotide reductase small subunit [Geobacillus kaustophilus HTA426]
MSVNQNEVNIDQELEALQDLSHESEESPKALAWKLYQMAIRFGTWNPQEIDLSEDKKHFKQLDEQRRAYLIHFCTGFWNAEENVALKFCPWIMIAPSIEQQAFLSTQLVDEFKHTEFFIRYFAEVLQTDREVKVLNLVHDTLDERARQLLSVLDKGPEEREIAMLEGLVHYQGVIEGIQAMVGYEVFEAVYGQYGLFPGLKEGFKQIKRDEGRHVGYGLRMMKYLSKNPSYAKRIKELFEEFLPKILVRYDQEIVVNGKRYDIPAEVNGKERLTRMYQRRLKDIFGLEANLV